MQAYKFKPGNTKANIVGENGGLIDVVVPMNRIDSIYNRNAKAG